MMKTEILSLRERAEALLNRSDHDHLDLTPDEIRQLVHDLSVYQVELELQNEDLRQTQRQLASSRQELADSRDRYARLYHQAPVGYLTLDDRGIIHEANQTFADWMGWKHPERPGRALVNYLGESDREQFRSRYRAFFEEPESKSLEMRLDGRNGRRFPIRLTGRREPADPLAVAVEPRLLAIVHDLSTLQAAENALDQSQRFTQHILDSLPAPMAVLDGTGRIILANAAWRRCARDGRYQPEQRARFARIGANYLAMCRLASVAHLGTPGMAGEAACAVQALEGIQAVLEGRLSTFSLEYPCHTPAAGCWFLMMVAPLELGHRGAVVMYTDISRQKETETQLRLSEQHLRMAIDGADLGIWHWDLAADRLDWSDRCKLHLGLPPGQSPTYAHFLAVLHPDDRDRVDRLIHQSLETRQDYAAEYRVFWPDGSQHWISARGRTYVSAQGVPTGMGGITLDIAARKQAEEELHQMRTATQAAEVANIAKSEFLAHISHEIRTPLNGVLGLIQVLERTALAVDQRDMVRQIHASGQSLLLILNDLLDLSKIEAGQLQLEKRPFTLKPLLARIKALLGINAHGKGLGFRITASPLLETRLLGDALRLEQILFNLIGNAIKFTERGEIQVRIGALEESVGRLRLRFEVQDTGIGIAPEALARLFAPFTQADGGITRRFGGTGLGLSICKQLVELMDGRIGAESQPGAGSIFWFELPFEPTSAEIPDTRPALTPERPSSPRLRGVRVLVVDDSAMNREVVERMLKLEGATATMAADGRQALECLAAAPDEFDAVLMDVQMPVMDGLTATRQIRAQPELTALPIIALTAGALKEQKQAARTAGMNDILVKPVDLEQLVAVLSQWISAPLAGSEESASGSPITVAPSASALPDIAGIDRVRAANTLGDDRAFFLRLLQGLIAEFADAAAQTRQALARGARESAIHRLHTLCGNAGNVGALELMATARALEEALRAGEQVETLETGLSRLDQQLTALVAASAPWREQTPAAVPPTDTPPLNAAAFNRLCIALQRQDLRGLRLFAELEPAIRDVLGDEVTTGLHQAIHGLLFQEALEELKARIRPDMLVD